MKNSEFLNLLTTMGKIDISNIKYESTISDILDTTHIRIDKEFMELSKIFTKMDRDIMELIFTMVTYETKQSVIEDIKEYARFITEIARKKKNWKFIIMDIAYAIENNAENLRETEFKTVFYDIDYGRVLHINGEDYLIDFYTDGSTNETVVDLLNKEEGYNYTNVIALEQDENKNVRIITSDEQIKDEDKLRIMFEVG